MRVTAEVERFLRCDDEEGIPDYTKEGLGSETVVLPL